MLHMDDAPTETLHIYVVPEEPPHVPMYPVFLLSFALSLLFILCYITSTIQPQVRTTIRIAVVPLPVQSSVVTAPILPSGIKTYPSIRAQGELVIYNGSILTQQLPAGMVLATNRGVEIMTNDSVYVPAGNPPSYGIARVAAHAAIAGTQGNIGPWMINQVYGTSFYIRNVKAFSGGKNGYSIKVITAYDKQTALDAARGQISDSLTVRHPDLLAYPCSEIIHWKNTHVTLTWNCQYVRYSIPSGMHVVSMKLVGKFLYANVWYIPQIKQRTRR